MPAIAERQLSLPEPSVLEAVESLARRRDAALDADTRKRRGVVHTPPSLALFVARVADELVRRELDRPDGLASDDVVLVDPATGPGVFHAAALEVTRGRESRPRALVGLDLDERAVRDARGALEWSLRARGWPYELATADALSSLTPVRALAKDDCVRVVLGNPPWAARSANRDAAVTEWLLDDFRKDGDGNSLGERKIGVLSDDYVRFVRWSLELVRRSERGGVIALVTNASFLDGPVHRGMRAAMARWLDRIEVVDLGGSALIARRGDRDENVFGVRPSVAITFGVRKPGVGVRRASVRVAALRGGRVEKLEKLASTPSIDALGATDVDAASTWRVPRGESSSSGAAGSSGAYARWPSLAEWMPFHREGLQTNRDALVIAPTRETLLAQLEQFADGSPRSSSAHWDADEARTVARRLLDDPSELDAHVREVAYRPFESRWALLHPALCHRPRPDLARAIERSPFALITARKDRGELPWTHFGAVRTLPDNCWLSTRSSCRARAFPTFAPDGAPNLDAKLAARVEDRIGRALDAVTFACWALAFLAHPAYRARHDAALRADYPRVPEPRDARELDAIASAGLDLVDAFLGAAPERDPEGARIGHHGPFALAALSPLRRG